MGSLYLVDPTTGNITTAGTITASGAITSTAGDITLKNQHSIIFDDTQLVPNAITLQSPSTISSSYTLKWPTAQGGASTVLTNDGSGNLSWGSGSGITALTSDVTASGTGSVVATIANSAVTTAKIAANAVTQVLTSRSGSSTPIGSTTITTQTITTSGNPVLITATANASGGNTTANGTHGAAYHITRDGNSVAGGRYDVIQYAPSGFNLEYPCSMIIVDSPVAGTYTYQFTYTYTSGEGSFSVTSYAFSVIELKR